MNKFALVRPKIRRLQMENFREIAELSELELSLEQELLRISAKLSAARFLSEQLRNLLESMNEDCDRCD